MYYTISFWVTDQLCIDQSSGDKQYDNQVAWIWETQTKAFKKELPVIGYKWLLILFISTAIQTKPIKPHYNRPICYLDQSTDLFTLFDDPSSC